MPATAARLAAFVLAAAFSATALADDDAPGSPPGELQGMPASEWISALVWTEEGGLAARSGDDRDLDEVLDVLTRPGPQARATVPALLEALTQAPTRPVAAEVLARLAREALLARDELAAQETLALLREPQATERVAALLSGAPPLRAAACRVLSAAGPAARRHVPQLVALLADPEWPARFVAVEPLGYIGGEEAVRALTAALTDRDDLVRRAAAPALGRLGAAAAPAVPALIDALSAPPTPPSPASGVLDIQPGFAALSAYALGRVGEPAAAAVAALANALGSPDLDLRRGASWALGQLAPAAATALPQLTEALADADPLVRSHAAKALGALGPRGRPALAALRARALDEQVATVKAAVDAAIRSIADDPGR